MLKILAIINDGYPVKGGAQMGTIAFLKALSRRFYYDCYLYTNSRFKIGHAFKDFKLSVFRDQEELKTMTLKLKPDIILAGKEISFYAVKLAKQFNIPVIVYMHDYIYCPPVPKEDKAWKLDMHMYGLKSKEEIDFVLKEADAVLVCSHYLKEWFRKRRGVRARVIYYEFDKDEFLIKNRGHSTARYITGIQGSTPAKGADIFIALARIFKNEEFLITLPNNPDINQSKYSELLKNEKNVILVPFSCVKKYLRLSKIILVPSLWPEPFGRIAVEAMACRIPVLASFTGGLKEIVEGSSLGVRKFRSIEAWQNKLEKLLSSPKAYELNAKEGEILSEKFLKGNAAGQLDDLISKLITHKKACNDKGKIIAFCGGTAEKSAYSLINTAWSGIAKNEIKYSIINIKNPMDFSIHPIDYFIHHDYSQDFKKVALPSEGKFIAVRSWDFGKFPTEWIKKITEECDQLWVYTRWIKEQAVKSGIPETRIKIVAPGVDEKIFKPAGKIYDLPTEKKFKFIFVGGTVERKGVDTLLKAYRKAFGPSDDVCLVIKDNKHDAVYKEINLKARILKMIKNKNSPEIIYMDEYFSVHDLACLYRACQAGVFPYRAEGFAMPIVEAMACGVACIVPDFGACLDFCDSTNSYLMPVKRINAPVGRSFLICNQGYQENIEEIDICEVLVDTLADYMRKVYHLSKQEREVKAQAAAWTVHDRFKWSDALAQMKKHLKDLDRYKTPVRLSQNRRDYAKCRKGFKLIDAATEMYLLNRAPTKKSRKIILPREYEKDNVDYFSKIYKYNYWGGKQSQSGRGSEGAFGAQKKDIIGQLINEHGIKRIIDIGCGDFYWMRQVKGLNTYLGVDIVSALIKENTKRYGNAKVSFQNLDLTDNEGYKKLTMTSCDLLICFDVFGHLTNAEVTNLLDVMLNKLDSKLLLVINRRDRNSFDYIKCEKTRDEGIDIEGHPLFIEKAPKKIKQYKALFPGDFFDLYKLNSQSRPTTIPFMPFSTCNVTDFMHPRFTEISGLMKCAVSYHRKLWELVFVVHHLLERGVVKSGNKGLVFGVGRERLPAIFAGMGAKIVATDAPIDIAKKAGWKQSGQFSDSLDQIRFPEIVNNDIFDSNVTYQSCNMNEIPPELSGFDFNWSSCCFEHLGSLEAGMQFVINAVEKTLRVGGVAVHTTEFNLSSNNGTIRKGGTVIYRHRDIEELLLRLRDRGHIVNSFCVAPNSHDWDFRIDVSPYTGNPHVKLMIGKYVATSAGIIVERGR